MRRLVQLQQLLGCRAGMPHCRGGWGKTQLLLTHYCHPLEQ